MGKEDLKIPITADASLAITEMAKTITKLEGMVSKMKEVNKTSKFADFGKDILKFAGGLGVATTGLGIVRSAINAIGNEWADVLRKEKEAFEEMKKDTLDFVNIVGMYAPSTQWEELNKKLDELAEKYGVKRENLYQVVQAWTAEMPMAPVGEKIAVAEMAAQIIPQQKRIEMTQAAVVLRENLPGKQINDYFDIVTKLWLICGKDAEMIKDTAKGIQQLKAVGLSDEDIIGIIFAAAETEQGIRSLTALASYIEGLKDIKKVERKGKLLRKQPFTQEEIIQNKLVAMTYEQRIAWLFAHPEEAVAYKAPVAILPLIQKERIAKGSKIAEEAMRTDEAQRQANLENEIAIQYKIVERRAAALETLKLKYKGGIRGGVRTWTEEFLGVGGVGIGPTEKALIMAAIEVEGRLTDTEYSQAAIKNLEKVRKRLAAEYVYKEDWVRVGPGPGERIKVRSEGIPNIEQNLDAARAVEQLKIDIRDFEISKQRQLEKEMQKYDKWAETPVAFMNYEDMLNCLKDIREELVKQNALRQNIILPSLRESE